MTSVRMGSQSGSMVDPHQHGNYGKVTKTITTKRNRRRERFCGACMNNCKIIISYAQVGKEAMAHFPSRKITLVKQVRSNRVLLSHRSTKRDRWPGQEKRKIVCLQGTILTIRYWYSENPDFCPHPGLTSRCYSYLFKFLHRYQ